MKMSLELIRNGKRRAGCYVFTLHYSCLYIHIYIHKII